MVRSVKRKFSIVLELRERDHDQSVARRLHITKAQNESSSHIVLKVLALAWFFELNPLIEPKLDYRYRPDVVVFTHPEELEPLIQESSGLTCNDLNIEEWIECKKTPPKKVRRILRNLDCHVSIFHRQSAIKGYKRALSRILKLKERSRICLYGVSGDFDLGYQLLEASQRIKLFRTNNSIVFGSFDREIDELFMIEKIPLEIAWEHHENTNHNHNFTRR